MKKINFYKFNLVYWRMKKKMDINFFFFVFSSLVAGNNVKKKNYVYMYFW